MQQLAFPQFRCPMSATLHLIPSFPIPGQPLAGFCPFFFYVPPQSGSNRTLKVPGTYFFYGTRKNQFGHNPSPDFFFFYGTPGLINFHPPPGNDCDPNSRSVPGTITYYPGGYRHPNNEGVKSFPPSFSLAREHWTSDQRQWLLPSQSGCFSLLSTGRSFPSLGLHPANRRVDHLVMSPDGALNFPFHFLCHLRRAEYLEPIGRPPIVPF